MNSNPERHRDEIARLCRVHRVQRLELFGSAVRSELGSASDLDFLVQFAPLHEGEHADAYFGLLADLQRLFDRPIDLVMTSAVRNPYFLKAIESSRTLLYAA